MTVEYRESIYVGYRYYDTAQKEVLYPFGHGLSYTTFAYRDLVITPSGDAVLARFKIKNTGKVPGKEIAQLYVRDVQSTIFRPDKELKGFAKVELQPGEETEVTLSLDRRAFAYYDVASRDWVVEAGEFGILVGASSRDIRLTATLALDAQGVVSPFDKGKLSSYYNLAADRNFSQADFETLLGRPIPPNVKPVKGTYTHTTTLGDTLDSFMGRRLFKLANSQAAKMVKDSGNPIMGTIIGVSIQETPLRTFRDALSQSRLEALILIMNGRIFKGLLAMIKSGFTRK